MTDWKIIQGDALHKLSDIEDGSIQTCITSPPYFNLRDYGVDGQIGSEKTVEDYVGNLVAVFQQVRRVLRDDGTAWLNLGDTYAGRGLPTGQTISDTKSSKVGNAKDMIQRRCGGQPGFKEKDLIGVPWRVALALQDDGWWLRSDIIWHKLNAMPESVTDRPTKSHEHIFLLAKKSKYYYDSEAIKEPSKKFRKEGRNAFRGQNAIRPKGKKRNEWQNRKLRNKRDVWSIGSQPFKDDHFAVFPERLIEPCVLAGSRPGDTVLDPFAGAGTTGLVALEHDRNFIGIELNSDYVDLAEKRITRRISGEPS